MTEARSRLLVAAALAGALASLSGCGISKLWSDDKPSYGPLPKIETGSPIERLWSVDTGAGADKQVLRLAPQVRDNTVYVADADGQVGAYSWSDGARRWEVDTDAPVSGGPGVGGDLVVVGTTQGDLIALDAATGAERWRAALSSEVLAAPAVTETVVVARTADGEVHARAKSDGSAVWRYGRAVPALSLRGDSAPVAVGPIVAVGLANGHLVGLALADGRERWDAAVAVPSGRSELDRMVDLDGDPLLVGDTLFVTSYQGRLAAVDATTGTVLWQREFSAFQGAVTDGAFLYISDAAGDVWSIDPGTGRALWRQQALAGRRLSPVGLADRWVGVGDNEGNLIWLAADDGHLVGHERIDRAGVTARPAGDGEQVVWLGDGGELAAYRPLAGR